MTGYRVAEEAPPAPLAVDPERCRAQYFKHLVALHGILTVFTVGLWLPGLLWALAGGAARKLADGYFARLRGGVLTVGNPRNATSIPLDRIDRVQVLDGRVVVFQPDQKGVAQINVWGLVDPHAAAEAILEARQDHLRGERGEPAYAEAPARRRRARS